MSTPNNDPPPAPAPNAAPPETPSPLPRAPILSYLSGTSTPTRARKVASIGVLIVGVVSLCLGLALAGLTLWEVHELATRYRRGSPTLADYRETLKYFPNYSYRQHYNLLYMLPLSAREYDLHARGALTGFLLASGTGLLILVRSVYRGRTLPSRLAVALLVPLFPLLLLVTVVTTCFGLIGGLEAASKSTARRWLLALPIGLFLILLLKDLCAYLLWIARNPILDKPPATFLPTKPQPR